MAVKGGGRREEARRARVASAFFSVFASDRQIITEDAGQADVPKAGGVVAHVSNCTVAGLSFLEEADVDLVAGCIECKRRDINIHTGLKKWDVYRGVDPARAHVSTYSILSVQCIDVSSSYDIWIWACFAQEPECST